MAESDKGNDTGASPTLAGEIGEILGQRRPWGTIAGLALGLALLAVAAWGVDLEAVWQAMQQAHPLWTGLSLLMVLLTLGGKVARWHGLFGRSLGPRYRSLARALVVGKLVSALIPARVGELARFYILGSDENMSRATVMGTIAAEKVFDLLLLVLAAGLTAVVVPLPAWLTGSLATAAGVGGAVFVAAMALPHPWITLAARRIGSRLPESAAVWLTDIVEHALIGLGSLRRPRLAAQACAWSVLVWSLMTATNLALFGAFDLNLSVGAALLVVTLINGVTIVPASPGDLGVFHSLTVLGLQSLAHGGSSGIDRATALAYATVLHVVVYGPRVLLGAVALGLRPRPKRPES